uniref:SPRY domain-containing protein n=1 Tax=Meloidogyne hapla TaxID=6305 RepID=A0A1I8B695_MELHA
MTEEGGSSNSDMNTEQLQTKYENEISDLKEIISQKDEKINSLEEQIKQVNVFFDKKFGEFKLELEQLNNITLKHVSFVQIKNKWKSIEEQQCCSNKCINTKKPVGNCIQGNGFINLINDENIKYINCVAGKDNRWPCIYNENSFKKPEYCFNYSLFYFEIKYKIEGGDKWMNIGLKNCDTDNYIDYSTLFNIISNEKEESFKIKQITLNDNDIFGCGLVYPPTNNKNEYPYVFFTKNGKQFGKGILLKENSDLYKPYIQLCLCSAEANFGNELTNKPFIYDISKTTILSEFY